MLNQITEIRLPDGSVVALVDWSDKPLFSTIEVLHGTTTQEMDFFQYVEGDSVPAFAPVAVTAQRTSNPKDTNMAAPGAMASTEEMLVYALLPEVWRRRVASAAAPNFQSPVALSCDNEPLTNSAMLAVLGHRCLLQMEISQKVFAQAGFSYFNSGFGPFVAMPATDSPKNIANQGLPSREAVRAMSLPMHIGGQEKFRVYLTNTDDGTGDGLEVGLFDSSECVDEGPVENTAVFARITVYMDGLYKRPVS